MPKAVRERLEHYAVREGVDFITVAFMAAYRPPNLLLGRWQAAQRRTES